ncbi:MAG: fibronectin type III domain-containing protein [Saprospiraceae bacterium]|nr:fibronectin type III domain-containing protein [Saprospiraceae bacterium]
MNSLMKRFMLMAISILFLNWPSEMMAQLSQQIVLPTDGSFSSENSPQGGLRYQRQLFLITPDEMAASGIPAATDLNSIGFTIAAAQDIPTEADFKLYLQNTTDTESRWDMDWTEVTTATNSLEIMGLFPGDYQWQVQAVCPEEPSSFTDVLEFSTADLSGCNQPMNLSVTAITASSATLQWYAPNSPGFSNYKVEYKPIDDNTWLEAVPAPATAMSVDIAGLISSKTYQWRIRTFCGADSSQLNQNSFTTLNVDNCNEADPLSLMVSSLPDTTASFSWDAVTGANSYSLRFRRVGSSVWFSTFAFTNSLLLNFGLEPGTRYEWQVRADCDAGQGAYVAGINFLTVGDVQCYSPTNLFVDNLSDNTATLHWTSTEGATSYNIRYRLKNSISWTNAIAPMAEIGIENGKITIPDTIGNFVIPFFAPTATFTYSGNGLYVAFEYSNPTDPLSSLNKALTTKEHSVMTDQYGMETRTILCLDGKNDTTDVELPEILTVSDFRPQTTFGSADFIDSVAVEAVYALGHLSTRFSGDNTVSALVSNFDIEDHTFMVHFEVSGPETYTETKPLMVPATDSLIVSFTDWHPTIEGDYTFSVSIDAQPNENVLSNNQAFYAQKVGPSTIGFDDGSAKVTHAGFGNGEGLILVKQSITGCGKVNSVEVFLDKTAADGDRDLYAVVMDDMGTILATSFTLNPTDKETGNYHSFYFADPPTVTNSTFYVGLAQIENTDEAYYPVGVQYETTFIREGAYFRAELDGTVLTDVPYPGRLMIKAEIVPEALIPVIDGDLVLCNGSSNLLSVNSFRTVRYANEVVDVSPVADELPFSGQQALGSPEVFPGGGINGEAWMTAASVAPAGYIELGFANSGPINYIDIYESYNPGGIEAVYVKDPINGFVPVSLATTVQLGDTSRINRILLPLTAFDVSEVRIEMAVDTIFHGIDAVSIGEISAADPMTTYLWSTGDMTSSTSANAAGTYTVTATDAGGCVSTTSVDVFDAEAVMMPAITVDGGAPTTFCTGGSVTLTAGEDSNILWSTGATTQSIVVSTSDSYTYDLTTGCGTLTSDPVVVTVNPLPSVSITGDLGICIAGTTTLDAGAGFASYTWTNGATTQTTTVGSPDEYSVMVTDNNGCQNSATVVTNIVAPPTPAISGNLGFCPGETTVLTAEAGFASYNWSSGGTGGDPSTQSITVNTADVFTVTVTNANGCEGSGSTATFIHTPPTPSISGASGFCPGNSIVLDAGAGYNAYNWSDGGTGGDPSGQTITVDAGNTYSVVVTDGNGCTGTDSQSVTEFVPPTPPIISGGLTFCGGNTTILDAGEGLSSYLWSTGETTSSIVVSTVGTFSVMVTDANGCTGADAVTTNMDGALPETPGPISGPSMGLCGGSGLVYSIDPVPNTTHYEWTVPNGMTIVSGQGTTSIVVDAIPNFTSGIIVAKANNACGQSPTFGQQYILAQGYPDLPGTPQGLSVISCESAGYYTIDPVAGADSYNWTVPAGSAIIGGQGTNTVLVKFYNFSGAGDICVDAVNSCGVSLCCIGNCLSITCTNEVIDLAGPGSGDEASVDGAEIVKGTTKVFEALGVYPNPNNGQFRLEGMIHAEGAMEIMIYSLLGDLVHYEQKGIVSKGMLKETVVAPHLAAGTYLLRVKIGSDTWNSRVIIMN